MDIVLHEKDGNIALNETTINNVVINILKRVENLEVENVIFENKNNYIFYVYITKNKFFNSYKNLEEIENILLRQISFNLGISDFTTIVNFK
ncbi:MAG: hypothetical protein LBB39_01760 [Mycoplasmataceae bacterium]|jgi:hypothetical protein|nr:hypothetical protein [Mycoplasmataceae bacterium]